MIGEMTDNMEDYHYPEDAIDYIDEKLGEIQDYLKSETNTGRIETLNKLIKLLTVLRVELEDRVISKIQSEIKSVNYAKLWEAFYDTVIRGDRIKINKAYRRLISGIRAANTLEFVEELQRFYLYIFTIRVWPHQEQLGATILGSRFRIDKIGKEIRVHLVDLKTEEIKKIGDVLKAELSPQEKELLTIAKKKINEIDFTEPLKCYKGDGRRKFFTYQEIFYETDKILEKYVTKPDNGL